MSKPLLSLAAALSLFAATPAVAYGGEAYGCDYCELFTYSPFRMQIEGGRTITQGWEAQYGASALASLAFDYEVPLAGLRRNAS